MQEIPVSLVLFTLLSGLAAGAFVVLHAALLLGKDSAVKSALHQVQARSAAWMAGIMAAALLASLTHLSQPLRFLNALSHPSSWLAQEAYWAIAFFLVTLGTGYLALKGREVPRALSAIGILVALGMVFSTGMLYAVLQAIPAWNGIYTVEFYLASALLMGAGCLATIAPSVSGGDGRSSLARAAAITGVVLVVLHAVIAALLDLQMTMQVAYVEVPAAWGLTGLRWIVGFIVPGALFYRMLKPGAVMKSMAYLTLAAIVVAEVLARVIFFVRGVHV